MRLRLQDDEGFFQTVAEGGAAAGAEHAQGHAPAGSFRRRAEIGQADARGKAVGIQAGTAPRVQQRVVDEGQIHEFGRLIVRRRVLVKEHERVDLAEIDLQVFPATAFDAAQRQRHIQLVPALRQDGGSVVGLGRAQLESGGVGSREAWIEAGQAVALAHAEVEKQFAIRLAQAASGQAHLGIAAPGQLGLRFAVDGRGAVGALSHGGQGNAGGNAFQGLHHARLFLHAQRLELDRFETGGQLRFILGQAFAAHGLHQLGVGGFQLLDTGFQGIGLGGKPAFQFAVARFQTGQAILQVLQGRGHLGGQFGGMRGQHAGHGQSRHGKFETAHQ